MKVLAVGCLIACVAVTPAWPDCVEPQSVAHLPDGASAGREEMISAMKALKIYVEAVKEFSSCVQKNGANQTDQASRAMDNMMAIADKFNAQLRIFKKKTGE